MAETLNTPALPESQLSRRKVLATTASGLAAAVAAVGIVGTSNTVAATAPPTDPIIEAIDAYHRGFEAFNASPDELWDTDEGHDALIAATYGPPLEVLNHWDSPAKSLAGAVAALGVAIEEIYYHGATEAAEAMIQAAYAFLADLEEANA